MKCSICGNNVAFPKKIYDGGLCRECAKKLPTPEMEMTVLMAKELMEYKGDSEHFTATANLGKLYIDYGHGTFVIGEKVDKKGKTETPFVFSVLDLADYAISFNIRLKKNGQPFPGSKRNTIVGDIHFKCSLNNPCVFISVPLARGKIVKYYYTDASHITWDEPMEVKEFRIAFQQMVKKAFTEYEDELKRRQARQEPVQEGANELQVAMAVFFLTEGYTKAQLRRQRNMLIKTFHPDSGQTGEEEYAQKINHYYEILLDNLTMNQ